MIVVFVELLDDLEMYHTLSKAYTHEHVIRYEKAMHDHLRMGC